jgi:hypothetical protein
MKTTAKTKRWRGSGLKRHNLTKLLTPLFVLSLLVGGGFLIGKDNTENVQATDEYTQVFFDDFNRPETSAGGVGNGWQDDYDLYKINSDERVVAVNYTDRQFLLRPDLIQDGKIDVIMPVPTANAFNRVYTIAARYDSDTTASYVAWVTVFKDGNSPTVEINPVISKLPGAGPNFAINNYRIATGPVVDIDQSTTFLRGELIVTSLSSTSTELEWNIYYGNDNVVSASTTDSTSGLHAVGQWGIYGYNNSGIYDDFTLSRKDEQLSLSADNENITFGDSVTYTITDDENCSVSLTDNGAGGVFSQTEVELNAGNSYSVAVTYTPIRAGYIDITGEIEGSTETLQSELFVSPYSNAIGFVGDSLSAGILPGNYVIPDLGSGFTFVNSAISGTSTNAWLSGSTNLNNAISSFQGGGVDVVHIMHGANDAAQNITAEQYKANLINISEALLDAGVKKVVISQPLGATSNMGYLTGDALDAQNALMTAYGEAIKEVVDGERILLGDASANEYFMGHTNLFVDAYHLTPNGQTKLGELWADAIRTNLEYQVNPDKAWVSGVDEHQLDQVGTLTLNIDKYFGELLSVSVDNTPLSTSDYTATAGSTIIELSNAYLNTLAAGNHTLTAEFYGGTNVSSNFTILAANTGGGNTGGQTGNNTPNVPNTGLFGLDKGATTSLFGIVATALLISAVLLGRKFLAKKN